MRPVPAPAPVPWSPAALEPLTAGRPEEGHLSLRSHPRLEEVPDLAQDRRGHQQRAFRIPQEAQACLVGVIP